MHSMFSFLKISDPVVSSLALAVTLGCFFAPADAQAFPVSDRGDGTFSNPVIYADVPDLCVTRAGDTYYMVSTTMHMSPGIPVMKSKDLVNWELASYCYAEIDRGDAFSLKNGKNDYASGSWASNIRYDEKLKRFFVINACNTTNKSYIFSTDNIEKGQWRCDVVEKCYDPGLILDGENRYVFYGQDGHHYRQMFVEPKT
ncbi:MAG TPA: family 43 glycosylhydrolase, partial [Roseimicrobium sp.]|nr:family 43 glycosylhydrolase [Roseimicrobium sp.]